MARTFWRSVKSRSPTDDDYKSPAALGRKPQRTDPVFLRDFAAVSVFDSPVAAVENARYFRFRMGEYVAELEVPDDPPFTCEGPDERGHWNLHAASPQLLQSYVRRVMHYSEIYPGESGAGQSG